MVRPPVGAGKRMRRTEGELELLEAEADKDDPTDEDGAGVWVDAIVLGGGNVLYGGGTRKKDNARRNIATAAVTCFPQAQVKHSLISEP